MPFYLGDFIRVYAGSRSGLSRTELLVFVTLVVILVGVGIGPIRDHLEKTKIDSAVESVRTINTLLSQYATDNDGVYPVGLGTAAAGKSEGIARNLLENNYTPDAAIFAVGSTVPYSGKAADFSDLGPANISWDFTAGSTPSIGIDSTAPDALPTVYSTGESIVYPTTPGTGLDLNLSGKGLFGSKGIVVAYKGNNATFIKGIRSDPSVTCEGFIPKTFQSKAGYTQIRP